MPSVPGRWIALVCLSGLVAVSPAAGQDSSDGLAEARQQEARALFQAAQVAYDAGRFEAALERFTEAYTLSHRPQLLYNIGLAAERLARRSEALAAYETYLQQHPSASNRDEVAGRIRSLEIALEADGSAQASGDQASHEFSPGSVARGAEQRARANREATTAPETRRRRRRLGIGIGAGAAGAIVIAVIAGVVASRGSKTLSYQSDFGAPTDLR